MQLDTQLDLPLSLNKLVVSSSPSPSKMVKQFSVIHFHDENIDHQVILLYALTEDGTIWELSGGKWNSFPISVTNES